MHEKTDGLRIFRWGVLILAAFYWLELFRRIEPETFGWQFRYLTIWALSLSVVSAAMMLRHMRGGSPPYVLAATTAIFNALVLLLYWRLYFTDPALVNGSGEIVAWREYYLHGAGPVLQIIDALLLFGAFRRPLATVAATLAGIVLYVGWIELLVGPRNAEPAGLVTSGLPYPFLNDLALGGRFEFYATTTVTGLVFIALGTIVTWARGRMLRGRAAPV
ncbi:hypothetical protein [Profundibacterium mesophilum]|uniref:FAR-17a/AIG1-like protein domain containing protein n=1 Tax=Profundibacterium mesophilum KAUST100406-0324 TaxID=1037889 RepID=A0A921NSV3_9RHOB|nr:hypothetical protein [Profundibacterium mesophilum]KAF0675934.1 FAR-17a/AIG1-like protein domain containing protein [Profundibacterium mesophilum KAUST100406-0324]